MVEFDKISGTTKKHNGINACLFIIEHHTGGGSFESNFKRLSTDPAEVSCHYVVGPNGEMGKIGNDTDILRHAGESKYKGYTDLNRYSIGIEIVSDGYNYTDKQRQAVKELTLYLMDLHNIQPANVLRHADISGYRGKRDVGDNFRNNKYKSRQERQNDLFSNTETMVIKNVITAVISLNSFLWDNIENDTLRKLLSEVNTELRKMV